MTSITDEQLIAHADRVKGKVVVITGAANGIGRETALLFSKYGAKIVIGDLDVTGAENTVAEIKSRGGEAAFLKCNVCTWDDQVNLFELAMSSFSAVDIVVPNAGITETPGFGTVVFKDGRPLPPNLKTLDVNLVGVMYTTHLAQHYLRLNRVEGSLKSLVFIGSMASWAAIPLAACYSASKHGVLGVMRSLHPIFEGEGMRVACIHPFFADTAIVPTVAKLFLAGVPKTPTERIAGAVLCSATDPDNYSNGCAWLLPDSGPVFMVPKEEFKLGVYNMIDNRRNILLKGTEGIRFYVAFILDLQKIFGKSVLTLAIGGVVMKYAWDHRASLVGFLN